MDNWKPEVGEWFVYDNPKRGTKEIYKAGETICWEYRLQPRSIKYCRPATLDDFKVYIPDYGYVLVCQYKNSWVLFFEKEEDGILFVKGNHIQRALVESFIRDRQAVVAPKRLWSHDPRCSTLRKYNG